MIMRILKSIKESNLNLFYIFFSAFIFRIFLANFGTLQLDFGTFVAWANSLNQEGFRSFYLGWSDYLPGYLYILFLLGKIGDLLPTFQPLIFKLPAILADLGTGYLIYKIAKQFKSKYSYLFALAYIFNPAIFANSTLWGQVDSLTAFFSVLAIYLFPKYLVASAVSLALGTLIKPQAAFVLPAILYMFIVYKKGIFQYFTYAIVGLTLFFAGFIPFQNTTSFYDFVLARLTISSGQYPYSSVNAFSFWGLFGFWKPDTVTFWIGLGIAIILTGSALTLSIIGKHKDKQYVLAGISLLATFVFMTRMHERHLLPILPFVLIGAIQIPGLIVSYLVLSITYLANLSYAYYWIKDDFKEIFNKFLINIFIVLNIFALGLTIALNFVKNLNTKFVSLWQSGVKALAKRQASFKDGAKYFESKDVSDKSAKILLSVILVFSFISRVYSLNLPREEYFDEVYHAFTARLMLNGDPKAWEWWNPHPEGFAYEWTHPPVAKLGMVFGMSVFGENAFGWRIVQAMLGVVSVYLVYLISKYLFKDKMIGILAAGVLSLDGLFLVMNRIGMNDSYIVFFMLLSLYLYFKDKHFYSAIAFGLALASKWSAIYATPIFLVAHFVLKKKIQPSYILFVILPPLIYVGSYTLMFLTGHTWEQFIEVQKQMWWYHTNLVAEHPYTSPAWTWPFLIRPIYLYNGPEVNMLVSRIYAFGNPLVFWAGLLSVVVSFSLVIKEKIKRLAFVLFAYFIFFIPWFLSPRIMFLYHYMPSIPFLAIATGYLLRRFPKVVPLFFCSSLILFIYFYPHWAGLVIPEWLDRSYYWFASWR